MTLKILCDVREINVNAFGTPVKGYEFLKCLACKVENKPTMVFGPLVRVSHSRS